MTTDAPPPLDPAPDAPTPTAQTTPPPAQRLTQGILTGDYVVLDGAGLDRCFTRVLDVEPGHLVVDLLGTRWRVRLDPERPPRLVLAAKVVAITSRRSVQSRPKGAPAA